MLGQLIISGLCIGGCYALIAVAMVIIYKTSEVLNFAQGEMAMLSTFVAFSLLETYHLPFLLSFCLTLVFALVLGIACEFFLLRQAKNPTTVGLIIITLGLEMILYGLAGWKWGAETRCLPSPLSDTRVYHIGNLIISELNLFTLVVGVVLILLLFVFFRYTRIGISMKATSQNPVAARILGIRTKRVLSLSWALSSVVGAIAGMLIAPISMLDPNMMMDPLLKGFAAAVLGGMNSLPGAALGGYLLGVIENIFGAYISLEFKSVVAFAIIVLILCIRPSGILSRHYVKRV